MNQPREWPGRFPGPNFRLTGFLARARKEDRKRIAALKREAQREVRAQ